MSEAGVLWRERKGAAAREKAGATGAPRSGTDSARRRVVMDGRGHRS